MRTGRFVLQSMKVGGKMREIRGGAITLNRETLGKDLLATRVEKRIVMGGWNVEPESFNQFTCQESGEDRSVEEIAVSDSNGKTPRPRPNPILMPKLSGGGTRIDAKLPRIGRKVTVSVAIPAVESEPVPISESEEFVPAIPAKTPPKPAKVPKVEAKTVEREPVKRRRRTKLKRVEPGEAVAAEEPTIPVVELKPSVSVTPEASADVKIRVVPTPRKRQPRIPEPQVESVVSATPKPIKVIRRRAEEAPKVFETAPKTVPKAMLEGVKLLVEEEGENPIE